MKRLFLIAVVLLLLAGIGIVAWTVAGLPPVSMVWRYSFDYGPEPTGRTLTVEGVEFVEIGPGCFLMGSDQGAEGGDMLGQWCARFGLPWGDQPKPSDEMPVHWVKFPRAYWIAKTEVTNEQYDAFDPRGRIFETEGDVGRPVELEGWSQSKKYCVWLSERSGLPVRLPSESEWECACRAGSRREFCFGDDERLLEGWGWYSANSGDLPHRVATRRANRWGLHDMHGNVSEWCEDRHRASYHGAPDDGSARAYRSSAAADWRGNHINRGGSCRSRAVGCRSADRASFYILEWNWHHGFRPAFCWR